MAQLTLIPTPVGNLEDITLRAIRLLKEVDTILAEDTRQSAKLCRHYEIGTPLLAYHKFNEHQTVERLIKRMHSGERFAMVSDGGTPGISDPGFLLVRACVEAGIEVDALPGATAFVPALVASGLPCDKFVFEGFLPHKKGRQTRIQLLAEEERTIVLYESPHRIGKTLGQLAEVFGDDRPACVCRELTKIYEEFRRGTLKELHNLYGNQKVKGEIVLLVGGKPSAKKRT